MSSLSPDLGHNHGSGSVLNQVWIQIPIQVLILIWVWIQVQVHVWIRADVPMIQVDLIQTDDYTITAVP